MNDIAELTIKINSLEAKLAQVDLDKLNQKGKETADTAAVLEKAWQKLAVVLSAGALALAVKNAIELQESYARLAEVAGTTAEAMSAMDLAARRGNTSLEAVAQSVAFLSKSLGEARFGDVQKQGIFKALGIDINDGRDASAVMYDVSKALVNMKDTNLATFASQQILSRGFAQMRPFMKDLVELGGGVSRVTNEQAQRAKELQDAVVELKYEWDLLWVDISSQLVPTLNAVVKAMTDFTKEAGEGSGAAAIFRTAIQGTASIVIGTAEAIYNTGRFIGGLAAIINAYVNKDYKGAAQLAKELDDDLANHAERTVARIKSIWASAAETPKPVAPGGAFDMGGVGGAGSAAEARLKQLAEDNRLYDERIAAAKGFADRYSDAIKTANTLAEEAQKQGIITDEELIRQVAANEEARLTVLKQSLQEQARLAAQKGDLGKSKEAQEQVEQANAAIIANEAVTTAKITSLQYEKAKAYRDWYQSVFDAGQEVFGTLQDEADRENELFQKRKEQLELFLADQRDAEIDAAQAREALEVRHQNQLLQIERNKHQAERNMQVGTLQLAAELLQQFAGKSKAAALAVIAIQKGLAIAQVVINAEAAKFQAMGNLPPPAWPAALATIETMEAISIGLIAATGLVEAYNATQSSGSASSLGGGGGGSSTPTSATPPVPVREVQQPITTIIRLEGQNYTRQQIEAFFEAVNENAVDGNRFVVESTGR